MFNISAIRSTTILYTLPRGSHVSIHHLSLSKPQIAIRTQIATNKRLTPELKEIVNKTLTAAKPFFKDLKPSEKAHLVIYPAKALNQPPIVVELTGARPANDDESTKKSGE